MYLYYFITIFRINNIECSSMEYNHKTKLHNNDKKESKLLTINILLYKHITLKFH